VRRSATLSFADYVDCPLMNCSIMRLSADELQHHAAAAELANDLGTRSFEQKLL
jgi:hypothetical protein